MSLKHTIIASALMIFTMICLGYFSHGENTPLNKPFSTFPKQIGKWVGVEEYFDTRVYDILGVDDSILSNYHSSDGRQVQLYIGFYRSQRESDLIHSPKNCMPGAGWNIIRTSLEELIIPNHNPDRIKVIKLLLKKADQKQVVLYWFQSRGRFIASEYKQKIYLVIDSIVKHRTDGSFVRLIAPVDNNNEEETLETLKDFAKLLIPILHDYLPS
jgi:EpsI family protein